MTDALSLTFRPSARLQRYLGAELIADPNVAIIEFVKNSYDAGASKVELSFGLDDEPTSLTIADDGVGMNLQVFRDNWMRPGFSEKGGVADPRTPVPNATLAQQREAGRVPVGEKGIGRLAAGRLGERLDVYTRRARNQPWLHVAFDWRDFDDMNRLLEDVAIAYDFDTPPPDRHFDVGTTLVISELSQGWHERVRGRAVRGRRRTRLGRLKQDLEFLVRPMAGANENFTISLDSDLTRDDDDVGDITPQSAVAEAEYSYWFKFEIVDGTPTIRREIHRGSEAARLAEATRHEILHPVAVTAALAKNEGRPNDLVCGPFEGRFLYNPPPAARRAREIDESVVGVLLYRDGVLVEPYGLNDDDWLGVRARKAQRQGHAAIQPDTFFGFIQINRKLNGLLRDQTNRLGLLDSPASENFVAHVRAEFRFFEELLYEEILETRWEGNREAEARMEAQQAQERSRIFLRAVAHNLRQPLQGLGYVVAALQVVRDYPTLPEELRPELDDILAQTKGHVANAERLIAPLVNAEVPEFASVSVHDMISRALQQNEMSASHQGVSIVVGRIPKPEVLVAPQLVEQALAAIVSNAIDAPRADGERPTVRVEGSTQGPAVLIRISDNGTGIAGADATTPVATISSTKGRPAVGLQSAESALIATNARLKLLETGSAGTIFEVALPLRVKGVRDQLLVSRR